MAESPGVIRILIADDHTIFRDGLRTLLSKEPDFMILGEAGNGREVVDLVRKLKPDVLLLDMQMPTMDGTSVLRALADAQSSVRTIILSGTLEGENISSLFELGARGLVMKDSATGMLFKCIRTVMAGQFWIGRQSVSDIVQSLKHSKNAARQAHPKNYGLTPREFEVIRTVVAGYSNNDIAVQLSISEQTVKHHITNIFDKLGVYNRLELTLFVFHHGLVDK
jgi:two-component system, NarL family, nitrate/nitrite response regulator NarL